MMNTMIIILIIYYVIGGIYYGALRIKDFYLHDEINQDNAHKAGVAGGLCGIFWLPLVLVEIVDRLISNESYGQICIDTIAYILYPINIIDDTIKKIDKTDDEEQ